jgi:hypothetical protein
MNSGGISPCGSCGYPTLGTGLCAICRTQLVNQQGVQR